MSSARGVQRVEASPHHRQMDSELEEILAGPNRFFFGGGGGGGAAAAAAVTKHPAQPPAPLSGRHPLHHHPAFTHSGRVVAGGGGGAVQMVSDTEGCGGEFESELEDDEGDDEELGGGAGGGGGSRPMILGGQLPNPQAAAAALAATIAAARALGSGSGGSIISSSSSGSSGAYLMTSQVGSSSSTVHPSAVLLRSPSHSATGISAPMTPPHHPYATTQMDSDISNILHGQPQQQQQQFPSYHMPIANPSSRGAATSAGAGATPTMVGSNGADRFLGVSESPSGSPVGGGLALSHRRKQPSFGSASGLMIQTNPVALQGGAGAAAGQRYPESAHATSAGGSSSSVSSFQHQQQNVTPTHGTRTMKHRPGQLSWGAGTLVQPFPFDGPDTSRDQQHPSTAGPTVGGGGGGGIGTARGGGAGGSGTARAATSGGDTARPITSRIHVVRVKDKDSSLMGGGGITSSNPSSIYNSNGLSLGGMGKVKIKFNSYGKKIIPEKMRAHGNYKMPNIPFYKNQNVVNRERALTLASPDDDSSGGGGGGEGDEEAGGSSSMIDEEGDDGEEEGHPRPKPLGDTSWHSRIDIPVYKADGELDQAYLARRHSHRQSVVVRSFLVYTLVYILTGVPYLLCLLDQRRDFTTDGGLWPGITRGAVAIAMALAAWGLARRHARDRNNYTRYIQVARADAEAHARAAAAGATIAVGGIGGSIGGGSGGSGSNGEGDSKPGSGAGAYAFFPTDRWVGFLVVMSGVALILMESFRSTAFLGTSPLVQDGLLLQLTLVYIFLYGMLRLSRAQALLSGVVLLATYNVVYLILLHSLDRGSNSFTLSYMLRCDAYQVLLLVGLSIYHTQLKDIQGKDLAQKKYMHLERRKADKLLRSMLPGSVYSTVLEGLNPYLSGIATIGFCNVELSYSDVAQPSPADLMQRLHDSFKRIDGIVSVYKSRGVHKIETVSKTYLLCCGLLEEVEDHAASMVDVCLEIMHMIQGRVQPKPKTASTAGGAGGAGGGVSAGNSVGKISSGLKIGIATGPVVGGIIGTQRRFFRVFGDTVNVSARMCTNCSESFQIQANKYAYDSLNEIQRSQYKVPQVRHLEIKGKGTMECYLITRRDDWIPRFGKAVMNRGREGAEDGEDGDPLAERAEVPSFVFHKIVRQTKLKTFPLLLYASTYLHHDPALLANEGIVVSGGSAGPNGSSSPSLNHGDATAQHLEARYQLQEVTMRSPKTQLNIAWSFVWITLCIAAFTYQRWSNSGDDDAAPAALASGSGGSTTAPPPPPPPSWGGRISTSPLFSAEFVCICLSILLLIGGHLVALWVVFRRRRSQVTQRSLARRAQTLSTLFAVGIGIWILCVLQFWGLNGGPIAPHFCYILLNIYIALYLHLQLRFLLPLMTLEFGGFLALLLAHDAPPYDIVFVTWFLAVLTIVLSYCTFKAENRQRANYLVQYALDMEQAQMDNFLKNLLPQFVVDVLKKSRGGGGAAAAGPSKRGSTITGGDTSEGSGGADARQARGGSMFSSLDPAAAGGGGGLTMVPSHMRRKSVFDDAGNMGGGGGGLASRFAMNFPNATVFESDIVGYTKLVSNWPAQRTLNMLNELFSMFDEVAGKCEVEKIETIGDAFMCVRFEDEPDAVLNFALDVIAGLMDMNEKRSGETPIEIRSGVCTGPCYGGVLGSDVPRFHMFGVAHDGSILLEQNGRPMTAMVSAATFLQACTRYSFEKRPDIVCEGLAQEGVWQLLGRTANPQQQPQQSASPMAAAATAAASTTAKARALSPFTTTNSAASPTPKKGWV